MFGISITDVVVVVVYTILMIGIGLVAMFRVKDQEDFFLGGRRFGKFFQMFSAFSQAAGSDTAVGTVTMTYRDGAGGICSHLNLLWATPLYWFTAPWYRRMRLLTMGDFFSERYQSRAMAMFYSLVASFFLVTVIGIGLKGVSLAVLGITLKPTSALTAAEQSEYGKALRLETLSKRNLPGGLNAGELNELQSLRLEAPRHEFSYLSEPQLVWFLVAVVFIYSVTGGLKAAIWNNSIHGTLILALSVLLIPFAVARLNALHGGSGILAAGQALHRELPGRFFSMFGSTQNADFTWYFIAALSVMATLNVAVQPNQFTTNASARNEFAARLGFMAGNFIKRFCTVLWGATGLLAYALYSRDIQNPGLAWGHATHDLLGAAGFGLIGLMIACLFSAFHSTAATLMISASSLFTKNVYEPLFPGRSEAHYLVVGRLAGAAVLVASAWMCIAYHTLLEMLKFFWEYNAVLAASFWCGLKWRRATRAGAWASMLTAFTLFLLLPSILPLVFPSLRTNPAFLATTREQILKQRYVASARDVQERRREIENWRGPGHPPPPLRVGETLAHTYSIPPRAIFWAEGIREINGSKRGEGLFRPEMVLFSRFFDPAQNPNALNETFRYAYKILLPFLVLIGISLLTKPDESREVQRFFLRMRVPVRMSRLEDERAVRAAYDIPKSTHAVLLFPNSQFEFLKWDREDAAGFLTGCLLAVAVVGLLYWVLHFGASA
jgi:solute:Na+ symporter, SSS family